MKQTHTPGPWEIADHGVIRGTDGMIRPFICQVQDDHNDAETQANARLIAAAPDLLSALRGMMDIFKEHEQYDDDSAVAVAEARAAIAKAEGRVE